MALLRWVLGSSPRMTERWVPWIAPLQPTSLMVSLSNHAQPGYAAETPLSLIAAAINVSRESFADAKLRKHDVENILNVDVAGDTSK